MNAKTLFFVSAIFFTTTATVPLFAQEKAQTQSELQNATATESSEQTEQENPLSFAQKLQKKLEKGDINGAIELYDELPKNLNSNTDLKLLHASLLFSAQKYAQADSIVKELVSNPKTRKDALEIKAQIAMASDNKEDLQNTLNQLLASAPYNPTANIILGNQQALRKKYKIAANYYKKALTGDGENQEALFGYGKMTYYLGELATSQAQFEKLLQIDSENSSAYYYLGKLSAEDEKYLSATKYIQKAIKIDPENYEYYIDLGQYMRSQGKYKEAEDAWTKAIELNPDYFLPYAYRAGLLDEQNRLEEALKDYNSLLEKNPKYYFAFEEIGILEFHTQNWEAARQAFTKANSIKKNTAYQLMIIATYLKEKNTFKAKEFAASCMKTMDRTSLEYQMVRLYHDQGPVNAENGIIKLLEKETDKTKKGKMTYYFGLYYELKGLQKVANEYYSKVTKMQNPMFFEYRLAEWGTYQ